MISHINVTNLLHVTVTSHKKEHRRFQNNNIIQHIHYMLTLWITYSLQNRLYKVSHRPTS